jgi:hypothetical protein
MKKLIFFSILGSGTLKKDLRNDGPGWRQTEPQVVDHRC